MPNRSRFNHRGGGSPTRRKTSWAAGPGGTGLLSLSASVTTLVGAFVTPSEVGLTIARIWGRLTGILISGTTGGDGFQGAFGIGVATAAAVNVGITAIPTPLTEQGSENWLYWTTFSAHRSNITSDTALVDIDVDTKAMRKFPGEMALYAALEVIEIGTATMSVFFDSRVLFFLP